MPYETQVENFTTHCSCGHSGPFCRTCTQALSRRSARPALTPPPRGWSGNRWTVFSRRRSRRFRRRGRVTSRVIAAAALHREEPGEAEHEEVEGAHHLVGEVESETRASSISLPDLTNEYSSMQLDERYHATSRLILKCDMPFRLPFSRNIQSTELPEMLPFDEISPLLNRSVPKIRIARTTAGTTATSP